MTHNLAIPRFVHPAEFVLRTDMALLGEWPPVPQLRCIVIFKISFNASVVVRLKALRCDGLRDRQCEDQRGYDGQVSHGSIIGQEWRDHQGGGVPTVLNGLCAG